jgi:hypothetical protein
MPDPVVEEFDFVAECIRTYRDAKDVIDRAKVLALLGKVLAPNLNVKRTPDGDPIAQRVQDALNGRKA